MRDSHTALLAGWVLLAGFLASPARADWPHWRGDGGNGVSLTAKPPVEFGPERNLRWKTAIPGRGSSSPVVIGERVFVTTAVPHEGEPGMIDFRLLGFDRETGREGHQRHEAGRDERREGRTRLRPRLGPGTLAAENDVGEGVDATPAPDGDSLFVRGERHLFRFAAE